MEDCDMIVGRKGEEMDLMEMVADKIHRDRIDQGVAAEQISQYEPMSRTTLNRFIKHERILNARHVIAMAQWVGFTDRESQLEFLQMYGFLSGFEEGMKERLTLEYRLDAIHKELEAIRREIQRKGKGGNSTQ